MNYLFCRSCGNIFGPEQTTEVNCPNCFSSATEFFSSKFAMPDSTIMEIENKTKKLENDEDFFNSNSIIGE